jgi:lipoyl(octanoyl) transferase
MLLEVRVSLAQASSAAGVVLAPAKVAPVELVDFLSVRKPNYESIWEFQRQRVESIALEESSECIIFCEHELVATKGRRAKSENILDAQVSLFEIERGGDVTLHAPGQLVIYPLLKLKGTHFPLGLNEYLRFCETVLIEFLTGCGLEAGRFGPTGVWIKRSNGEVKKIASIGVAVRRWITYHGIALNVCNDLEDFKRIRPCDFEWSVMTSLRAEGVKLSVHQTAVELKKLFTKNLRSGDGLER